MKRKTTFRRKAWRKREIELLCAHYPNIGAKGCKAILPGRTLYGIQVKASILQLREVRA